MKKIMTFLIGFLITLSSFGQDSWETPMSENFEDVFPSNGWYTYGVPFSGLPWYYDQYWGVTDMVGHNSQHSAWCLGGGSESVIYPHIVKYLDSWMVYGPFDLSDSGINSAEFNFWYDYHYAPDLVKGYFVIRITTDTSTWNIPYPTDTINLPYTRTYYNYGNAVWMYKSINLSNYLGETGIFIAFHLYEENGDYDYGGLVDDVELRKEIIHVGITENTQKNNISVYPNPSNGNFTVDNLTVNEIIVLYNSMGQIIFKEKVVDTQMKFNLDISPGVYILNIGKETKKLVIQ